MVKLQRSLFLILFAFLTSNLFSQECWAENPKAFQKLTPELLRKLATEALA